MDVYLKRILFSPMMGKLLLLVVVELEVREFSVN